MRATPQTLQVLQTVQKMLGSSERPYASAICQTLGLKSGTVCPILKRAVEAGWLRTYPESTRERRHSGPARVYYARTRKGVHGIRAFLASHSEIQKR